MTSLLKITLLCSIACAVLSANVSFKKDQAATCATQGVCDFTNPALWDPSVPAKGDSVLIQPDTAIFLTISQPLNLAKLDISMTNLAINNAVNATTFNATMSVITSTNAVLNFTTMELRVGAVLAAAGAKLVTKTSTLQSGSMISIQSISFSANTLSIMPQANVTIQNGIAETDATNQVTIKNFINYDNFNMLCFNTATANSIKNIIGHLGSFTRTVNCNITLGFNETAIFNGTIVASANNQLTVNSLTTGNQAWFTEEAGAAGTIEFTGKNYFHYPLSITESVTISGSTGSDVDIAVGALTVRNDGQLVFSGAHTLTATSVALQNKARVNLENTTVNTPSIQVMGGSVLTLSQTTTVATISTDAKSELQIKNPSSTTGALTLLGTVSTSFVNATAHNKVFITASAPVNLNGTLYAEFDKAINQLKKANFTLITAPAVTGKFAKLEVNEDKLQTKSLTVYQTATDVVVGFNYFAAKGKSDKFPVAAIVLLVLLPVVLIIIGAVYFFRKRFSYRSLD